jgi:hypothetical protein
MQQIALMNDEERFGQVADDRSTTSSPRTPSATPTSSRTHRQPDFAAKVKEAARKRAYRITPTVRDEALARLRGMDRRRLRDATRAGAGRGRPPQRDSRAQVQLRAHRTSAAEAGDTPSWTTCAAPTRPSGSRCGTTSARLTDIEPGRRTDATRDADARPRSAGGTASMRCSAGVG